MVRSLRRCGADGDVRDAGRKAVGACVFHALGGGQAQSPVAGSRFGRDAIAWQIRGKKEVEGWPAAASSRAGRWPRVRHPRVGAGWRASKRGGLVRGGHGE
jgi:hypothetical protein